MHYGSYLKKILKDILAAPQVLQTVSWHLALFDQWSVILLIYILAIATAAVLVDSNVYLANVGDSRSVLAEVDETGMLYQRWKTP